MTGAAPEGAAPEHLDTPNEAITLDCHQYTFSPLLLFTEGSYFDKGHSNYNAVVTFFAPVLQVDMLQGVLYDKMNLKYDELLAHVLDRRMLVTCCIDAHFTAFQVPSLLSGISLLSALPPLHSNLALITPHHSARLVIRC